MEKVVLVALVLLVFGLVQLQHRDFQIAAAQSELLLSMY